MKKIIFLAFSLLLAATAGASAIQLTKLEKFPESYGPHKPKGASVCRGEVDQLKLQKFPWIKVRLKTGIECLSGDFDGNGQTDYALLKNGWTTDTNSVSGTELVVLMMDAKGIKEVRQLENARSTFNLALYPPARKKGRYGEPATKNPGLVEWGEGDDTRVWIYEANKFSASTHASEEE